MLDLDDFGNVSGSQKSLDGKRMAMRQSYRLAGKKPMDQELKEKKRIKLTRAHKLDAPLRTAEAEAVGQLAPQSLPELRLLLVGKLKQRVVVLLKLLILLLERRIVSPAVSALAAAATTASTATSTTVLSLFARN